MQPFQKHSETSHAAAVAIEPRSGILERLVLDTIRQAGARGLTDNEGMALLSMNGSTYRPRRITLAEKGFVREHGKRLTESGRSAVVWVASMPESLF